MERVDSTAYAVFIGRDDWVGHLSYYGLKYLLHDEHPEMVHCGIYMPRSGLIYEMCLNGIGTRKYEDATVIASVPLTTPDYVLYERICSMYSLECAGVHTNWLHWLWWGYNRRGCVCTTMVVAALYPFLFSDTSPTPGELYDVLVEQDDEYTEQELQQGWP